MKNLVFLNEEEVKIINGGSEASLGLVESIGYYLKKWANAYVKYAPSTQTLVNCSAT